MIDYKKYWLTDNLRNIVAGSDTENPEGWDPVEVLEEILKSLNFETVLDFGCGYGRLCKAFQPKHYTGIDLNPQAIQEAQNRYPDYFFKEIELDSEYDNVDIILAYTVFLHLDDDIIGSILQRLRKACKKYLIIGEILGREWRRPGDPPVFNRNYDDYISLLQRHGFQVINEYKLPYKRYADSSYFKNNNTDLSFLICT
jgi:SAM-dependent methyltransferase